MKYHNKTKWEQANKVIPNGVQLLSKHPDWILPGEWPIYYQKAKGIEVFAANSQGKVVSYLDFTHCGVGTCLLGYAHSGVNFAVKEAIDNGNMCSLNNEIEIQLAEKLLETHPWADKVRYARTGGEAMAIAIRLARAMTGKKCVFHTSYHGWHDWYLDGDVQGRPKAGVLDNYSNHIDYGEDLSTVPYSFEDVAAFVVEPQKTNLNWLKEVKKLCKKEGIVLIYDEITTGFRFRIGGLHLDTKFDPDIVVFGKAMSNGYPMAAVIGKQEVMEAKTFISSTYWSEAIGPKASLATINIMERTKERCIFDKISGEFVLESIWKKIQNTGKAVIKNWKNLAEDTGLVIKVNDIPQLAHLKFPSLAHQTLFSKIMLREGFLAGPVFYPTGAHEKEHIEKYFDSCAYAFKVLSNVDQEQAKAMLNGPVAKAGYGRSI